MNYKYSSQLKKEINDFLKYKMDKRQSLHPIACYLYQFDQFLLDYKEKELTRELVEKWLTLKDNENRNTLRMRAWSIKSFSKYLNLIGINAYIVDSKPYNCKTEYIPHIFSNEEIIFFFKQLDLVVKNSKHFPNNKQQIKLLFKILYCCGLRDSEVLNLKYENIDLENKCLIIKNSKNGVSRLVHFNDELYDALKTYVEKYSNGLLFESVFKNHRNNKKRSLSSIHLVFKTIIQNDEFDKNFHYRIHDFRHTFAVKNIKKVYENGDNVYSFLPILMTYMGHSDIRSTEYYLRFTPDVYQKVTKQFEEYFRDAIPKIDGDNYE